MSLRNLPKHYEALTGLPLQEEWNLSTGIHNDFLQVFPNILVPYRIEKGRGTALVTDTASSANSMNVLVNILR